MSKLSDVDVLPWYRQFWPWFLIALPASVVVAGISMIFVAFENADPLVNDNYYQEGMAINRVLEQDDKARELGVSAKVVVDQETGEVMVNVIGQANADETLTLLLLHPTDDKRDRQLELRTMGRGYFRTDLDTRLNSRYYLRLISQDQSWRLNGEIDFSKIDQVTLTPQ